MTSFQHIADVQDRVMTALVAGLELEFGRGAGEALAHRFLDAEELDFTWDARGEERWLGTYESDEEEDEDGLILLDRVAILGQLDGEYIVATLIVDGDGNPHGMLGKRGFATESAAREAFGAVH